MCWTTTRSRSRPAQLRSRHISQPDSSLLGRARTARCSSRQAARFPDEATLIQPDLRDRGIQGQMGLCGQPGNNNTRSEQYAERHWRLRDRPSHPPVDPDCRRARLAPGPDRVCMLEDPSNQFIYTANFNDSTVTGQVDRPERRRSETLARQSQPQLSADWPGDLVHGDRTHQLEGAMTSGRRLAVGRSLPQVPEAPDSCKHEAESRTRLVHEASAVRFPNLIFRARVPVR